MRLGSSRLLRFTGRIFATNTSFHSTSLYGTPAHARGTALCSSGGDVCRSGAAASVLSLLQCLCAIRFVIKLSVVRLLCLAGSTSLYRTLSSCSWYCSVLWRREMCVGMALLLQCCPCAICFVINSSAPFNCPNSSKFIKTNAYCPSFLLSRTATPARALLCTVGIAFRSFAAGLFVALLSALPLCALVRGCVVLKTSAAHLLPLLLPQRCLCVMQL